MRRREEVVDQAMDEVLAQGAMTKGHEVVRLGEIKESFLLF